jgi:hypothetical protein
MSASREGRRSTKNLFLRMTFLKDCADDLGRLGNQVIRRGRSPEFAYGHFKGHRQLLQPSISEMVHPRAKIMIFSTLQSRDDVSNHCCFGRFVQ